MSKKYRVEGTTLIFNNGVTSINENDLHKQNTKYTGFKELKDDVMGITSIIIPDSVTKIDDYAFAWCETLAGITIPDSVKVIGDSAFFRCETLASIIIPDSVTDIGDRAFTFCECLERATIPNGIAKIEDYTFMGCEKLTNVTIPNSVTDIGKGAFGLCTSLTHIIIPDNVSEIGENSFYGCDSLTNITIPNNVTKIGKEAFVNQSLTFQTKDKIPYTIELWGAWAEESIAHEALNSFIQNPTFDNFKKINAPDFKLPIALAYGMSEHSEDKLYQNYIKERKDKFLSYIIETNNAEALDFYCNIDLFSMKLINQALQSLEIEDKSQLKIILMKYKEQNKGYDERKGKGRFDL